MLGVDVTNADVALQLDKFDEDGATPSRFLLVLKCIRYFYFYLTVPLHLGLL